MAERKSGQLMPLLMKLAAVLLCRNWLSANTDGPKVVRSVLLVPERVEPRHRSRFDVRHGQDVAEIVRAEERTVGDESVDVDQPALPSCKLLQVEIELRLDGAERDRAGLDPTADVSKEIGSVGQRKRNAVALEVRPQASPIPRKVRLTCRRWIVRVDRLAPRLGRKHVRCGGQGDCATGQSEKASCPRPVPLGSKHVTSALAGKFAQLPRH